jgi:hypothetical protein
MLFDSKIVTEQPEVAADLSGPLERGRLAAGDAGILGCFLLGELQLLAGALDLRAIFVELHREFEKVTTITLRHFTAYFFLHHIPTSRAEKRVCGHGRAA